MINVFISIFIAVLIGVGFIGPISQQVNTAAAQCPPSGYPLYTTNLGTTLCSNGTASTNASADGLYTSSTWGASTLKMVPGFYALVILGVTIGGLFAVFRQTGLQ